jgi:hypothetical protein
MATTEETMAALIQDWSPFSLPPPSSSIDTYSADDEMDTDTDTDTEDPGVSETVFDWTVFLSRIPALVEIPWGLQRGIMTTIDIPEDVYLGDIGGERKYVWEVQPDDYDKIIWVFEDCVLDVSNPEFRNMLSYVREGGSGINCILTYFTDPEGECRVGLKTTRPIRMGEELLYWHPEMM